MSTEEVPNLTYHYLSDAAGRNNSIAYRIRTVAAILLGLACGLFGVQGWPAIVVFFFAAAIVDFIIMQASRTLSQRHPDLVFSALPYALMRECAKSNVRYPGCAFLNIVDVLSYSSVTQGLPTFLLFWTIAYDCVWIF
eukprot:TRINITY_DN26677_c0_g1_i1.p1 TRINITY_DN26677_c0_g1~~TRINITY_DN26677_c0_g1_i1.p1  ORF type:complete len:138 (+),score=3.37 TRINITY_DN26677_c0_g1_i1:88-501(+)